MDSAGLIQRGRHLACPPLTSAEAARYPGALNAQANSAFTHHPMMAFRVREAFERVMGSARQELGITQVYDVAHNIAKWEMYEADGRKCRRFTPFSGPHVCPVRRQGAPIDFLLFPSGMRWYFVRTGIAVAVPPFP